MGKPFFTKKQKAHMRERRKKKKVGQQQEKGGADEEQTEVETSNIQLVEKINGENIGQESKKRPRDDNEEVSEPASKKKTKHLELELTTRVIDGKLHVILPSDLSSKDAKKYRKDARRQLRMEGKIDDASPEIAFATEEELPHAKKKKKKNFPSIKELMVQKKELEKTTKAEEKVKAKIQQVPDDIKGQYVALDCEMVGIGSDGKKSALARVSMVDWDGNVLLDSFVKVPIRVTDFRTHVSGVEPKHIKGDAMEVEKCRDVVADILKNKILVGHALSNDLKALMLTHPKSKIRDTSKYRPFQRFANGKWRARKLRDLVKENIKGKEGFQQAEHDSVQDAQATMELFHLVRSGWEKEIASKTK